MSEEPSRRPRRTCVGCRRQRPQDELLRIARTPDGVRFDPTGRLPGRGAYLCPDVSCVDAAARRDGASLRRALRGAPENEVNAALDAVREAVTGTSDPGTPRDTEGVAHA